ncbi:hypothetical protein NL676_002473 [Syzygium grande]|nr:hypothetical protein NL676_002473 [Syzygium grande]
MSNSQSVRMKLLQVQGEQLDGVILKVVEVPRPVSQQQQCKKSNLTVLSSKWLRFRDLFRSSNSDRKESFVFLTSSSS